MVSLSCSVTRTDGVTLVTGVVTNPDRPRRVRLESRLDGPVWPPRTSGVPVEGWDGTGFECTLAAGESRPVGYASPATPTDPPMELVATEPVDAEAVEGGSDGDTPAVEPTVEDVVRELDSPRPPRDAVTVARPTATDGDRDGAETEERADAEPERQTQSAGDLGAVESMLAAVEARVERAERLSAETHLATATEVVDGLGGVEGVRDLDRQLATDAERLSRLADRAGSLAERAEATEVPTELVERFR